MIQGRSNNSGGKGGDELTERIIGCCYEVHTELGPGFQERIYSSALKNTLEHAGLKYAAERSYQVTFKESPVGSFRLDLLVEDRVIVEVKAVTGQMPRVFESQVLAYLKAAGLPVGLLVNFGNKSCQVRRLMLNTVRDARSSL